MAVEAVGAVSERDAGVRVGPGDLPAGAPVPEGRGRVRLAEPPVVSVVVAGDHDAERAIRLLAEDRVAQLAVADLARKAQRFGLPDLRA